MGTPVHSPEHARFCSTNEKTRSSSAGAGVLSTICRRTSEVRTSILNSEVRPKWAALGPCKDMTPVLMLVAVSKPLHSMVAPAGRPMLAARVMVIRLAALLTYLVCAKLELG